MRDEFGIMIHEQGLRGMRQLLDDFNQVKTLEAPSHSVLVSPDGTVDPALSVDNNGNVGIGITSPTVRLDTEVSDTSAIPTDASLITDSTIARFYNSNNSAVYAGIMIHTRTSGSARALIGVEWQASFQGDLFFRLRNAAGTSFEAARITSPDGYLGIGRTDPQGQIHTYDSISGFLNWEFDGLNATVQTIIPNGAGDVLYRLTALYVLRNSAGAVASGTTDVSNGASVNLVVGADTVRLRVNADGSVDTNRTAGANTIKVAYTLRWL